MAENAVNVLMENLEQLINYKIDIISQEKDQIESLHEELGFLRIFLKDLEEKFYKHEEVKNLETRIRDVAYEAENTIDSFLVDASWKIGSASNRSLNLDHVKQEIEAIKIDVMKIYDMGAIQVGNSSKGDSSRANTPTWEEEMMVGFDDEATVITEKLVGGQKGLEVISIVGMPGIGKTTLAKKVYNDPYVMYHFYIRAWIYVSQEYQKRDLLLGFLSSFTEHTDEIDQMSDEKLAEKLYKGLKGRIYFIVMDDIWDGGAWDDVKNYFPNDNNGSRILFTSRLSSVALHAKSSSPPLPLRFLTHDESWDLLRQKVFRRETCPPELIEIGKQIAKKCQGLPLAIVVVAGILVNEERRQDRWMQIGKSVNSWMDGDEQPWMKIIALSYNHLPHHLKSCFLYFAAFPEDFQIPVRKLIWLWVAEGFIWKAGEKSLEDIAEEYLMDLIGRSLVLVLGRGYNGGIKACGIHDLLHDFCLKKAEEEYFLKQITDHAHFPFSPFTPKHFSGMRRLCIHPSILQNNSLIPSTENTRSFLCIASVQLSSSLFLFRCFKLIRVLDISSISIPRYPSEIEPLVLLRYLALCTFSMRSLPASISNLWNLETLILATSLPVTLPQCIRKMVKLRHLCFTGLGKLEIEGRGSPARYPFSLDNLQTLSWVNPRTCWDFLDVSPNLRKLGCRGDMVDWLGCLTFPHLDYLNHLQKLKLFNTAKSGRSYNLGRIKLPTSLKKLTLEETRLKWDEISNLGKLLPNLEGLKLLSGACSGLDWETGDGEFPRLKFLKFAYLDIVWWNACSDHFPSLQRLVLVGCQELERIPSEIGYIPTLQMVEIHRCNGSVANSAREIKEEQESMGNDWLQIRVLR